MGDSLASRGLDNTGLVGLGVVAVAPAEGEAGVLHCDD